MKKTKEQISFNMKQVKNKDSKIEVALRKELWEQGFTVSKKCDKYIRKTRFGVQGQKSCCVL